MQWKNSETRYGSIGKCLHGITALGVIIMLGLGLVLANTDAAWKRPAIEIHKSIGIIILVLTALSILWRFYTKPPQRLATMGPLAKAAARLNYVLLYTLMLAMPLTGWAMNSSFGKPVFLFGVITLPDLIAKDLHTALILKDLHGWLGYLLLTLTGLHILASLYHQAVLKDGIMKRMF